MAEEKALQSSDPRFAMDIDYNPYKKFGDPYEDIPIEDLPDSERSKMKSYVRRCTARSKRKMQAGLLWPDNRCNNMCVAGTNVCKNHGGGTKTTHAGRPVVHGKYSSKLPKELEEDIDWALHDPELLSLKRTIASLDVFVDELNEKMPDALEAIKAMAHEGPMGESAPMVVTFMKEWNKLLEQRRKATDSERRLQEFQERAVPIESVLVFMRYIGAAIEEEVKDEADKARLVRRLRKVWDKKELPAA
jgi:hypothetical protein